VPPISPRNLMSHRTTQAFRPITGIGCGAGFKTPLPLQWRPKGLSDEMMWYVCRRRDFENQRTRIKLWCRLGWACAKFMVIRLSYRSRRHSWLLISALRNKNDHLVGRMKRYLNTQLIESRQLLIDPQQKMRPRFLKRTKDLANHGQIQIQPSSRLSTAKSNETE